MRMPKMINETEPELGEKSGGKLRMTEAQKAKVMLEQEMLSENGGADQYQQKLRAPKEIDAETQELMVAVEQATE